MESLTSLFQCHLELQSGSLLYVSSMELPLPAPGLPKPSHCWFSWNWDNHLALSSWCLHELLHDLTSPTVPILLFPTSGEVPAQEPCPEAKLTLCSSVFAKHWALQKEDCFCLKAVRGERKTPKSGAFLHGERCAFLGDSCEKAVCAALLVPMVFTHSWGSNCFLQLLRGDGKNEPLLPPVRGFGPMCLSTFSAGLFQPCRGCCAQPQPRPMEQSLCSQGISSPKYSRLGPASCATLPAFAGCAGFYPRSRDEGISLGSWCAHRGQQHTGRGEGR